MSGLLAVAFRADTLARALEELPRVAQEAELVELRLDFFDEPYDLAALLSARGGTAVVVTLRSPEEGGRSTLDAPSRVRELVRAAELGAEYVDLEWNAATPEAVAAARAAGARVIVSRHDFQRMPAGFADEWWPQLAASGADVVKIVGTAHDVRECLPVLRALRQAQRPTIAIAMGASGLPSRILSLREPMCLLTYAAPTTMPGTAPGQLTVAELRSVYHAGRLSPATDVYGLLGPHAEPERAAEYNAWFVSASLDAVAVSFPCTANAAATLQAYRELPVAGWHIHGEALQRDAISALDDLDGKARGQGKVNAIVVRGDALCGSWVESPQEQFDYWVSGIPN